MQLEVVTTNEIRQFQKDKYCSFLMCIVPRFYTVT